MPRVQIKGTNQYIDFPDDMPQDVIRAMLSQGFPRSMSETVSDRLNPVSVAAPVETTLRDRFGNTVREGLEGVGFSRNTARNFAEDAQNISDFIPITAAAYAGDEFGREMREEDYLGATGSAIEGALEMNPVANTVGTGLMAGLMGVKKAGDTVTREIGDISERFMSGFGKTDEGLGRKGEKARIENTTLGEVVFGSEPDPVSIFDLEGKPFVTVPYDRSSINRGITSINDKELVYPIQTEGGIGYLTNPESDFSAASEKSVINKMIKARDKAAEISGSEDVLFIPHSMGQTGVDHSTMPLEVMFAYAGTNLSKKNQKELNKKIKELIPDFAGVDNPESVRQISNITGAKRKKILKIVDKYRDKGGLSAPQARAIITDPDQMNIDDLKAINVATMDKQGQAIPTDDHSTYKFGIKGKPIGRLEEDLDITELLSTKFNQDNKDLFEKDRVWRALQMKPYMGQITDDVLRGIERKTTPESLIDAAFSTPKARNTELSGVGVRVQNNPNQEIKSSTQGNLGPGVYLYEKDTPGLSDKLISRGLMNRIGKGGDPYSMQLEYDKNLNLYETSKKVLSDAQVQQIKDAGFDGVRRVVDGVPQEINIFDPENVKPPKNKEADNYIPPPENAQRTQIATTTGTYKKAREILGKGKTLDFGAGLGKGAKEIGADTYEPFPKDWNPNFTDASSIPSNSYPKITNLNVLNVVPKSIRDGIVQDIGRVLKPGGTAIITTRGRDVMDALKSGKAGPEPMSVITSRDTYQKGFTQKELKEYIQETLGDNFEVINNKLGAAGVTVKKKV